MKRREFFVKAMPLVLVPFVKLSAKGHELDAVEVIPRKFLIFFDARTVDIKTLAEADIPGWENIDALFIPVHLREGQTVAGALHLVEQFEEPRVPPNVGDQLRRRIERIEEHLREKFGERP